MKIASMMKLGLLALVVVIAIGGICYLIFPKPTVALTDLDQREGVFYLDAESEGFTGVAIDRFEGGSLKSETEYKDGKPHGFSLAYFKNGTMQVREDFRHGVSHGTRTKWYASGVKASEGRIVDGEFDGVFRRWDEAGQLVIEIQMKNGAPDGISRSWYSDGSLKTEVVMEQGRELSRREFSPVGSDEDL